MPLSADDDAVANAGKRHRSGAAKRHQVEEEEWANLDLGLDPADAEGLAWRDRNRAEAELQAASVRASTDATVAWA